MSNDGHGQDHDAPGVWQAQAHQVKKSLELMAKEVLPNLNKEKIVIPAQPLASLI